MLYFTARAIMATPTIYLMAYCVKYFCVFAPRYMPAKPPMPKRTLSGQFGMGDIPFVAGMNLKDRAPAADVRNDHDIEDMIRAAY
jgi:hypothetical protein